MKNHPPDLINVALERLVEASLELPAFSTLDEMATSIRAEVNAQIFAGIAARIGPDGRQRALGLLNTAGPDGRSMFNRLKKPAQRATWSRFKAQAEYLDEVDALGDTARWLEGVAPAKVADFAGEAAAQDADTLSRYADAKKLALVACLIHTARMRARDDLAEMLCKRVASILKKARTELEEIRLRQRAVSERLIGTYRTVLEHLDPDGEAAAQEPGQEASRAVAAVEEAGGFAAQMSDIEEVSAYHGDNYEVLVHRFFCKDRAVMFELAGWTWSRPPATTRCWPRCSTPAPTTPRGATTSRCRRGLMARPPTRASRSRRGTGGARSPTAAIPAWWSGGTSRRWCSPTWPKNCEPGTSRSQGPGSTTTGARTCCRGRSARRCWRGSAPGPGCPRRRQGSPNGSGTPTWTTPPGWTPGTRTTPTW
jgi:hypothetical protein